jgi:FkbM family methyltransferase
MEKNEKKYFSQNDEEKYIIEYFFNENKNNVGKYIEIGSFHPTIFSNTRALFEMGWSGVLVEPSPICIKSLEEAYSDEPRIKLIQAAITDSDGEVKFYESKGDAISSTSIEHKEKWEKGYDVKYNEITVKSISMDTFLKEYGQDVDFINIDVESTNWQLFNLIPDWFFNRLKMICIEHDGKNVEMENKLKTFGFRKILLNPENLIMVK